MLKNKWFWVVLLVFIFVIAGYQFNQEDPIKVRLAPVSHGTVDLTVSNTRAGTVKACNRSRLSLPIGGQIAKLYVTEGDHVKKGQVLIQLWNKDQKARYEGAKAQVAVSKLTVVEQCRLADRNKREHKRLKGLAAKKLVSIDRLDNAATQMVVSAAGCEKSKATIDSAKATEALQAAVLEKTELTAPFAGVIAEINGEVGEYITPSPSGVATPPAVDLIADDCLYISAPVDEVEAAQITKGLKVNVTLDAFRGEVFAGEVTRIAPYVKELEKQARTVDVDVKLMDAVQQNKLLIGYSADIDVIIQQQKGTLRLPTETVIEGNSVLLFDSITKKLVLKKFVPGISNWRFTEIKEGLSNDDQVLMSLDVDGAIDGAKVRIEE
jgi:HlyD family secretion protein